MKALKKTLKGAMSINTLIGMIVVALILGVLIEIIADYSIGVSGTGNVTGATATVLDLIPVALVLAVIVAFFKGVSK
jgi:hypothetical protein